MEKEPLLQPSEPDAIESETAASSTRIPRTPTKKNFTPKKPLKTVTLAQSPARRSLGPGFAPKQSPNGKQKRKSSSTEKTPLKADNNIPDFKANTKTSRRTLEVPEEPQEVKETNLSISKFSAFVSLVKGNVGPGCLVLPCVFSDAGIVAATGALVLVSFMALIAPWLLIDAKRNLELIASESGKAGKKTSTYEDIAKATLGRRGGHIAKVSTCALQLGICTVFLHYVAENANAMYDGISMQEWSFIFAGLALLISLGRSVRALNRFTLVATAAMTLALITVFYITAAWIPHHVTLKDITHQRPLLPNSILPVVIAVGNLAYTGSTGVCLLLPIENALSEKDKKSFLSIAMSALAVASLIFLLIGAGCSLVFASKTTPLCSEDCSSVTALFMIHNYGSHDVLMVLNGLLICGVLLTFPLQLFPAVSTLENYLHIGPEASVGKKAPTVLQVIRAGQHRPRASTAVYKTSNIDDLKKINKVKKRAVTYAGATIPTMGSGAINSAPPKVEVSEEKDKRRYGRWDPVLWRMLRLFLVAVAATAAAFIPDLTIIISLVGCCTSSILAMLLPVWMNMVSRRKAGIRNSIGVILIYILFIIMGIFTLTVGNAFTMIKLVRAFSTPNNSSGFADYP
eukprot:m.22851 g.22851  ORF g.22851 m.22851 type:complete len:628 (+) comp7444_c0_seq4:216-2099(+)